MPTTFPVLSEKYLDRVPKRMGGIIPSRRPLDELPRQVPGTVLVFNTGAKWEKADSRLTGTEAIVVNAVSVSVVQTRSQDVDVRIDIPSASSEDFAICVRFTCRVLRPEIVAEHGPVDVGDILTNFLRQDNGLLMLGQGTKIEDVRQLRIKADARVRAYCYEAIPEVPGVHVAFSSVHVLTDNVVREHEKAVRDAQWDQELALLLAAYEDTDVQRLAAYLKVPENIAAIGLRRGQIDLGTLITTAYSDRASKDANILEFLKLLEQNGQLDRLPINAQVLVNTLMERFTGAETKSLEDAAGVPLAIGADALTSLDPARRKEERFVVDNHQ